jgi:HK97 family phage major capsid protein
MNFPELTDAQGKLENRQKQLADIFAEANPGGEGSIDLAKVKCIDGSSTEKAAAIKALNDEMSALGATIGNLKAVAGASEAAKAFGSLNGEAGDSSERPASAKSFGDQFAASGAFATKGSKAEIDVSVKALFDTDAGIPESTRSGLFVDSAQRPVQVTDLLPTTPWGQSSYKFMEETTFTNNAAERAEGGAYAEAALALTERARQIESVGVYLPMTDEQLEDGLYAAAYVNGRLPFMVRQRLDSQLLVGSGTTPNIEGINNVSGIQTQATGSDTSPDAIYKAMTKIKTIGFAMPNAVIMNPVDWQRIRLLRTTDGIYIWGSPSEAAPARIWGLNVAEAVAQTEATAVVGDFANYSMLVERRGIEVKISDSHSTDFVNGKQAVRAGIRVAAVWTRPAAFATVTGLDGA